MPPGLDDRIPTVTVWEYQKDLRNQTETQKNGFCRRDKNSNDVKSPDDIVLLISQQQDEPAIPSEKCKTLLSFCFSWTVLILNTICLAYIHDRVPDRTKVGPLPDILFDLFPPQDWALDVTEIIIMASLCVVFILFVIFKYRFILMRRVFLMMGCLYLMRSVTIFVTQLPVASDTYYCSPQVNETTPLIVVRRVLQLSAGFGLSINGKHTYCGDYIYSGHTISLTLAYLVIKEYTPIKYRLLHWMSWLASVTGVIMIVLARGHYTIDVIIAYYVTTRLFWMYHSIANNSSLKNRRASNHLSRLWWFSMFLYMEANVPEDVPKHFEWPLPWPKKEHPRVS